MNFNKIPDLEQRMPDRRIYIALYLILFSAYLGGLFLQLMEVDAAQYAAMSQQMLKSGSYLKLFDGGIPYLDKPPLLIWMSCASFYLFGVSELAYRIPSFLASIFAVYSCYKLARLWYNETIANWSALILASCQAFFLFNQDVKTDNLLTSMTIFAIWQLSSFTRTQKIKHLIFSAIGIGLAMLAKGPIGLILPVAAIGSDLLLKRQWKMIFNLRWLIAIPLIFLVISPFLIGLYQQWGSQGLKFYFWTQSFGRITGESEWDNGSGPFFFVHNFLWAFLPWTIASLFALFASGKELIKSKFRLGENEEGITIGGFILVFIALSMSHYKLPHYIFVLFPLSAIFTARWIYILSESAGPAYRWLARIQLFIYALIVIAVLALLAYIFKPVHPVIFMVVAVTATMAFTFAIRGTSAQARIIITGVISIAAVNIGLNWEFYPRLLDFQASNKAGRMVRQLNDPENFYFYYLNGSHSLNFYSDRINPGLNLTSLKYRIKQSNLWLYVDDVYIKEIMNYKRVNNEKDIVFLDYPVQKLSLEFLNPDTRSKVLRKIFLVHLAKQ